ncbi:hypothetical protein DPX16_3542 [Anabarilius grahami]|uniref:Uncharacterized protein n=1 Tax=Anabarilius grahami TaxID=495550 RepID=A0A3N0YZ01_ANAGA|nr:hypothetical protein DPX16_3542 [Anabarilius grahami]
MVVTVREASRTLNHYNLQPQRRRCLPTNLRRMVMRLLVALNCVAQYSNLSQRTRRHIANLSQLFDLWQPLGGPLPEGIRSWHKEEEGIPSDEAEDAKRTRPFTFKCLITFLITLYKIFGAVSAQRPKTAPEDPLRNGESGGIIKGRVQASMKKKVYEVENLPIKTFDGLVTSPGFVQAEDKGLYLLSMLAVSDQEKQQIEQATVGQAKNASWFAYRKKRITASNFGLVLAAVKKSSYPPSLFKTLLGQYNFKEGSKGEENVYVRQVFRRERLPQRMHLCILAQDSSGSLLTPRASPPHGAIKELRCPSRWLSSIDFRVIGWRTEERGNEKGY